MMASKVVSFRQDEEAIRFVREQGLNPHELARGAFERELARLHSESPRKILEAWAGRSPGLEPFERDRRDRF